MTPGDSSASKPSLKPKPSESRPPVDQTQQQQQHQQQPSLQQPPLQQPQYQQHPQNPLYSNPPYYQQHPQQPTNPALGLQYPQDQMFMQPQQQQQQLALYQVTDMKKYK